MAVAGRVELVTRIDDQGAYIFGAAVQGKKWMRASRKECAFPDGPSDLAMNI